MTGRRFCWLLCAGMFALVVAGPASASAAPPVRGTVPMEFHAVVPADVPNGCGFEVQYDRVGTVEFILHFDRAGTPVMTNLRYNFVDTFTNPANGQSVSAAVIRVHLNRFDPTGTRNPDGTITYYDDFHGIYRLSVVKGQGAVEVAAGHWVAYFTVAPDGTLVEKGFADLPGNPPGPLDVPGGLPALCDLLR